jgi:hypothetical protein
MTRLTSGPAVKLNPRNFRSCGRATALFASFTLSLSHKFDPSTNWANEIDLKTGKPILNPSKMTKEGVNVKDICPAAQGAKNHQPASYDPKTNCSM